MNFAHPEWLWLLVLVPLVGVGWWWISTRRNGAGVRYSDVGPTQAAPTTWLMRLRHMPSALRLGAVALGILALAQPYQEDERIERTTEGIDIMMALDLSSSMLADDFEPNRFEAALDVAHDFVDTRVSDRVGITVFAGEAYTHAPLTLDYDFLEAMLDEIHMDMVIDGTAIGMAIASALNRLRASDAESRVIILLTDGVNNRGEIDPITAAEMAAALDVRIYTIGIGTVDEKPRPDEDPAAQAGDEVAVGIDEETMQTVSDLTDAQYFHAEDREGLADVYAEIDDLEQTEIEETVYTDREERFAIFLWPALALLALDVLLSTTLLRRFP